MSKLFDTFQQWKLARARFEPEPPAVVDGIPQFRPIPNCHLCCHLTKKEYALEDGEVMYGFCNITTRYISNHQYPWQCNDFYTGVDD